MAFDGFQRIYNGKTDLGIDGDLRWAVGCDEDATGDYKFKAYDDAGALVATPIAIDRATGDVILAGGGASVGEIIVAKGAARAGISLGANDGQRRTIQFKTDGVTAWEAGADEAGDWIVERRDAGGAFASTPFKIDLATGNVTFAHDVTITGSLVGGGAVSLDRIVLAGGAGIPSSDDNKDRGLAFNYYSGASPLVGFMGWDDSAQRFKLASIATIASEVVTFGTLGHLEIETLHAVGGDFSGPVLASGGQFVLDVTVGQALTVSGTSTFEDTAVFEQALQAQGAVLFGAPRFTVGGIAAPSSTTTDDRGMLFRYHDGAARLGFVGWDSDATEIIFASRVTDGGGALSSITYANIRAGNANFNNDVTVAGSLTVNGTLILNGATTEINSTIVTIDDPILTLGGDTAPVSDDNKDRGVIFRYYNGSALAGFMGWDDSAGLFILASSVVNTAEVMGSITYGSLHAYGGIFDGSLFADSLTMPGNITAVGGSVTQLANLSINSAGGGRMAVTIDASQTLAKTLNFVLADFNRTIDLTGGSLTTSGTVTALSGSHTGASSNTNTGDQFTAVVDQRLLGNVSGITAAAIPLTQAQIRTMLGLATGDAVTFGAINVLAGTLLGITNLRIASSTTPAFDLRIQNTDTLTANRTFAINTGDAVLRTLDLTGGSLTTSGTVTALSGSHTGASSNTNTGDQFLSIVGNSVLLNQSASAGPAVAVAASTLGHVLTNTGGGVGWAAPATVTLTFSGGDVTGVGGNNIPLTIGAGTVTYAKIQNVSAGLTVLGRSGVLSGSIVEITGTADQVLRVNGAGTALGFGAIDTGGITNAAVTYAKVQAVGGISVLGRAANTSGTVGEISGTGDQVLRLNSAGTALAFGTITAGGLASGAVTLAKMDVMANASMLGNVSGSSAAPQVLSVAQIKTLLSLAGSNSGDQTITLTGFVTGTGTGSFATTLAGVVPLASLGNCFNNGILGNISGGPAPAIALSTSQVKTLLTLGAADSVNFTGITLAGSTAVKATGTAWTNPSDLRHKIIIARYTVGLDAIMRLLPTIYRGAPGNVAGIPIDQNQVGFIAQEVGGYDDDPGPFPEAVTQNKDGFLDLDTSNFLPASINAIQELARKVASLEHANENLKQVVADLLAA